MGCHALLQGIFLTQALKPWLWHLLYWQAGALPLTPRGKPHTIVIEDITELMNCVIDITCCLKLGSSTWNERKEGYMIQEGEDHVRMEAETGLM